MKSKHPVQFNLKVGMKNAELQAELHGRVSGESRQEVQSFFMPIEPTKKYMKEIAGPASWLDGEEFVKYDVVAISEEYEYAVLLRNDYYRIEQDVETYDKDGKVIKTTPWVSEGVNSRYYIAGINDEGRYFLHPLEGLGFRIPVDFEEIIQWLNKADEGYAIRLQGDLMIKFVPKMQGTFSRERNSRMSGWGPCLKYELWGQRHVLAEIPVVVDREAVTHYDDRQGREVIDTPAVEHVAKRRMVNLGRHIVTCDGTMAASDDRQHLVVDANEVNVQHPDHGHTKQEIPPEHYAVVTGQRGRDIEVPPPTGENPSGSSGSSKGFD